jgi:hypothetical protein
MALDDDDRTLVRRLAALLRLADGLDADHFQVVEAATVVDGGDHLRLELRARDVPDLAMWAAERNGDLFELEFGRHIEPVAVELPRDSRCTGDARHRPPPPVITQERRPWSERRTFIRYGCRVQAAGPLQ